MAKVGISLKTNHHTKFCLSKSLKNTVVDSMQVVLEIMIKCCSLLNKQLKSKASQIIKKIKT